MRKNRIPALISLLLCLLTVSGCSKEKTVSFDAFIDPTALPLTEDQLSACTEWFAQTENNGLLRVPYTNAAEDPAQLVPYLEILLYDMGETDLTERELALLADAGAYMDLDKFRLSRALIAGYLKEKFGIDAGSAANILADPDPAPAGIYLDEYDAWYIVHSDTWFEAYTFACGEKCADGTVRLFYVNPLLTAATETGSCEFFRDQPMVLTLRCTDGIWYVVSNEILE